MILRCVTSLLLILVQFEVVAAADERLSVLPPATESTSQTTLRTALQQACDSALADRREAYEQVKTPEEVREWQQARREFFLEQLGGFPERTPLNPRVVGRLEGDGYRLEKVIFESRPNHHVTGNLYLPKSVPPWPAVIVPCGHSYNGKASEAYQRVSILMAINGIAAFCYDPIGQGERYQTFAPDGTPLSAEYDVNPNSLRRLEGIPGGPRFNPVEEHTLVGIGSILVGRNTATYRIYDGMRCIDYLVSREDIDGQRIGCTGQSGGGTLTAYLMALDERIVCAAPACYLTTFERLLATSGPQDAEQNIFGQIAFGMDQGDYVLMRAPRPTCLVAGTHDSTFDIRGTWEIFREGKRFFSRLGHPERIDMVEADSPHTFTSPLRIGCVRWMRRWLLETDDAITEPDFPVWSEEELQCTPQGQVMLLDGERSVFDFNREEAARLAEQRKAASAGISTDHFLDSVRRKVGVSRWDEIPARKARSSGEVQRQGYQIEKLLLEGEDQLPLLALAFVPERQQEEAILYLHGEGKSIDAGQGGPIEKLVRQGHLVLAVDLSGIGETAADAATEGRRRHWSEPLFGKDGEEFWLAYLMGKSLIGLRTEDALAAAKFLQHFRTSGNEPRAVRVIGIGRSGLPALHAVALESERFVSLTLEGALSSWQEVIKSPLGNEHLTETVHGTLRVYDLPDLIERIGEDRVTITNPLIPR
jgi:dienelactone hydrolase